MRSPVIHALALVVVAACTSKQAPLDAAKLKQFATDYTAAWCSQDPARVAAHYSENGVLAINGARAVGRAAITADAKSFMAAYPDLIVTMDSLILTGSHPLYHWTLTGTGTGPGGALRAVRLSGYEEWTIGADGLIAESQGHYDAADEQRQLMGVNAKATRP